MQYGLNVQPAIQHLVVLMKIGIPRNRSVWATLHLRWDETIYVNVVYEVTYETPNAVTFEREAIENKAQKIEKNWQETKEKKIYRI